MVSERGVMKQDGLAYITDLTDGPSVPLSPGAPCSMFAPTATFPMALPAAMSEDIWNPAVSTTQMLVAPGRSRSAAHITAEPTDLGKERHRVQQKGMSALKIVIRSLYRSVELRFEQIPAYLS